MAAKPLTQSQVDIVFCDIFPLKETTFSPPLSRSNVIASIGDGIGDGSLTIDSETSDIRMSVSVYRKKRQRKRRSKSTTPWRVTIPVRRDRPLDEDVTSMSEDEPRRDRSSQNHREEAVRELDRVLAMNPVQEFDEGIPTDDGDSRGADGDENMAVAIDNRQSSGDEVCGVWTFTFRGLSEHLVKKCVFRLIFDKLKISHNK